jgi:hypothetical protein
MIWSLANFINRPHGTQEHIHVRYGGQPQASSSQDILWLKLIVQHPPTRLSFFCAVQLRLATPPWQPVLRTLSAPFFLGL